MNVTVTELFALVDGLIARSDTPTNSMLERILMNQTQLAQALADLSAQAAKAKSEIVDKVAALESAIANSGSTTPEVDAALADLKGQLQALDDLNPDAAAPAPAPEPEPAPVDPNAPINPDSPSA